MTSILVLLGLLALGSVPRNSVIPTERPGWTPRPRVVVLGRLSDEERRRLGRLGVRRTLPDSILDGGTWTMLADGRAVWRLVIQSPDATGMRVEFSGFDVEHGKVWVHSAESTDGPYIGRGPNGNGEFWSGTVDGESVVVEYEVAPGERASGMPPFQIHRVTHQEEQDRIVLPPIT